METLNCKHHHWTTFSSFSTLSVQFIAIASTLQNNVLKVPLTSSPHIVTIILIFT
ncbi:hypothetical protein DICPUDRAFT_159446 [Dictyostelium purpureum]|uniref:Uncharacterized protein n=1 Tax=Dictyostelium purpureum TaxID=5786 RepID=F1A455_DICPU|nr:uncharacterized protein DICPUDRAFT_159446 [Dictyostelium purpureum]EGC29021.1 hypothetical protein DICPUDRAFT_159446 [Dictyostelium purpureum]|eukprot:XP_003294449.1 hypothetical protein DICPUDRAFT_159446 [Dictyostelium purpureum]